MAIVPVVHASSIIIISSVPKTALRSLTHASLKFASAKRLQEELLVLKSELRGLIDKDEAVPRFADQMMDFTTERQRDEAMPMRDAVRHFLSVVLSITGHLSDLPVAGCWHILVD
jgi:hypothetical protein